MKRLELIREKERKKRDEIRMKNRQKTMKSFKVKIFYNYKWPKMEPYSNQTNAVYFKT